MMSIGRFVIQWFLQIHNALNRIHVKEFGRIFVVRLQVVRDHLIDPGVVVLGNDFQYGRTEWRSFGHRYVVAVVFDFRWTIVHILYEYIDGNFSWNENFFGNLVKRKR